jgi:hypothetical protein
MAQAHTDKTQLNQVVASQWHIAVEGVQKMKSMH